MICLVSNCYFYFAKSIWTNHKQSSDYFFCKPIKTNDIHLQKKLYFGAILPDIGSQLSELQQFEIVFFSRLFNIIGTVVTKTKLFEMPLLERNQQLRHETST